MKIKCACLPAALGAALWLALAFPASGADSSIGERISSPSIVAHGGAGTLASRSGEVAEAVEAAKKALENGGDALEAAIAGAVVLEDNPSFNAGTGSNIRMDGNAVQMDAAVMNERGDYGAVAVIERVKNPIRVARAVMESPHLLVAGEGAVRLARSLDMADYDPRTKESMRRYRRLLERMRENRLGEEWADFDWKEHWNFPRGLDEVLVPNDTIGIVVHDGEGGFAVAISTGGTSTTLYGRVGDVPIMGAGSFAGPAGAVCVTGWGEYIIREHLSKRVYEWMAEGASPKEAIERGLALFPSKIGIGLIAVSASGASAGSNTNMAWARYAGGEMVRADD